MDKYDYIVRKNIKKVLPMLPTRREGKNIAEIDRPLYVSFDKFSDVKIEELESVNTVEIYDEEAVGLTPLPAAEYRRAYLLKMINSATSIKKVKLHLSDETLSMYNKILQYYPIRRNINIEYYLDLNRRPTSKVLGHGLEECQGKLIIDKENLMFENIHKLSNVLEKDNYESSKELKGIVDRVCFEIMRKCDVEKLNPLERTMLIYDYIRRNIRFASECTYRNNAGVTCIIPTMNYCADSVETFKRKSGVCEGQAKLAKALLKNSTFNVDCEVLEGIVSDGTNHAWIGVVVDDKLYQVCLTMGKLFTDTGYRLCNNNNYPKIYRMGIVDEKTKQLMKINIQKSIRK